VQVRCIPNGNRTLTITIADTFDLMFDFSQAYRDRYDTRKWFRTPSPSDAEPTTDEVAEDRLKETLLAEDILVADIEAKIARWTDGKDNADGVFDPGRHLPPRLPYDVFAIAAHLVEQSGIYHHIQPTKKAVAGSCGVSNSDSSRHLEIDDADREQITVAAQAWRSLPRRDPKANLEDFAKSVLASPHWTALEPLFESWWIVFARHADSDVRERPEDGNRKVQPDWWRHAWRLLAIADEAAAGTGFVFDVDEVQAYLDGADSEIVWFEADVILEHVVRSSGALEITSGDKQEFADVSSLSVARRSMLNVLPKVRTPSVGCTLRSISHHLALLPPDGIVKGHWTPNYRRRPTREAENFPDRRMNLLLVPLPYSVGPRCFRPSQIEDCGGAPKIGYFDVDQDWLAADGRDCPLEIFLDDLIMAAKSHASEIHGVVLPELALDYERFVKIKNLLRDRCEGIELIVSGTSTNREGDVGNFVAASTFKDTSAGLEGGRETVREKHHRWKLDAQQIRDYGLQGRLSPDLAWWENIPLQSRQVDFTVMRRDSVFAAMICEDLARVDPCQQIIRAVGPNLVIALLMDAPQIEARWPARYATVLAEDPGCAVLTLTSRGLMTLQDRIGTHRSNGSDRVIALWRDDSSARPTTLECPYDAQGVLLTIVEGGSNDVSLDGRCDGHAKAWRHAGHLPVRIEGARSRHAAILGPENLASL